MPTLEDILKNSQNSDDLILDNSFKSNYVAETIVKNQNTEPLPEFKTPRIQSIATNNVQNYEPLKITGESKKVRDVVIKSIEGQNGEIPDFNFYKVQGQNGEIPNFDATRIIGKDYDPNNLSTVDIAMALSLTSPELIDTSLGLMVGKTGGVDQSLANVESTNYKQRTGIISALNAEWENLSNGWQSLKTSFGNLGSATENALVGSATNAMKRVTAVGNNALYRVDNLINSIPSKVTGFLNDLIFGNGAPYGVADLPVGASSISLGLGSIVNKANNSVNTLFDNIDNAINNVLNKKYIEESKVTPIDPTDLLYRRNILWHLSLAAWNTEAYSQLYNDHIGMGLNIEASNESGMMQNAVINTGGLTSLVKPGSPIPVSGPNKMNVSPDFSKTAAGVGGINGTGKYYIGPALKGYSSIEGTHPRVDNFYDFKLIAPQVNVNRGLPVPWRLKEQPAPQRVENFMDLWMDSKTGDGYKTQNKTGTLKSVSKDFIQESYDNKNILLLSNMAEISTIEVSTGETINLGDWGNPALIKRIDQIAKITTVIYEDRQHSVRKWLEAYKYYMYGPQPNPNIHKPIFQCWYRLQYYLLNNDRSIAYSRGFRVLPNFNLNMTPSDDIKEFIISWDVIGEDLLIDNTTATTYNRNVLKIPWNQQLDRDRVRSKNKTAKELESDVVYNQPTAAEG